MSAANTMTASTHTVRAKNLNELLVGIVADAPAVEVRDLTINSRAVARGTAFVALPGLRTHGVAFANDAVACGAHVVLWEPVDAVTAPALPSHVVSVAIPNLTRVLGEIADRFFEKPSEDVAVTAVTGTNGKTTTAFMLAAAFESLGRDAAYAGTLGYGRVAAVHARPHTTPDCISVHRELAELRDSGVRFLGMEVTSHALDQHRVAGMRFQSAIFTNLTRDHLDYHGTFEAYGEAKARLFDWPGLEHAIINVDDAFGRDLAKRSHGAEVTVCSSQSKCDEFKGYASHVIAERVSASPLGLDITLNSSWGQGALHSRLIGAFNVDNLLAVLGALLNAGINYDDAIKAVEVTQAPPGRMEMLIAPGKPLAVIDYAHTPDALEKALQAIRKHCTGKLWCVFGCGGERDVGKRPLMGAIAERLADALVVTDDNPRGEDGDAIVQGILAGMRAPDRVRVERDRARAIEFALTHALAGDAVLIAGKGHEDYQIVGGVTRHFSDREVASAALGRRS